MEDLKRVLLDLTGVITFETMRSALSLQGVLLDRRSNIRGDSLPVTSQQYLRGVLLDRRGYVRPGEVLNPGCRSGGRSGEAATAANPPHGRRTVPDEASRRHAARATDPAVRC